MFDGHGFCFIKGSKSVSAESSFADLRLVENGCLWYLEVTVRGNI